MTSKECSLDIRSEAFGSLQCNPGEPPLLTTPWNALTAGRHRALIRISQADGTEKRRKGGSWTDEAAASVSGCSRVEAVLITYASGQRPQAKQYDAMAH
jgi:hypothetical protein